MNIKVNPLLKRHSILNRKKPNVIKQTIQNSKSSSIIKNPFSNLKKKKNKVYIIGGGPSIKEHNLSTLTDGDIIAINKSIDYVDHANFFITMDYSFLNHKIDMETIKTKSDKSIFIVNNVHKYITKKPDGFYYDTRFNLKQTLIKQLDVIIESKQTFDKQNGFGFDLKNFANGDNSGYCAVQLALLLEYDEIYLLGFDLKTNGTTTHFHNDYKQSFQKFNANLQRYRYFFTQSFKRLNKSIKNKIKSASKDSFLNVLIEYKDINKMKEISNVTPDNKHIELKDLLVIAYFTVNTPYEKEKEKLVASCNRFGLNYYIKGVKNLGDWQKNTRYKATFVKECLLKFPTKKLLYVDADAIFNSYPSLFINYNCDIAILRL